MIRKIEDKLKDVEKPLYVDQAQEANETNQKKTSLLDDLEKEKNILTEKHGNVQKVTKLFACNKFQLLFETRTHLQMPNLNINEV